METFHSVRDVPSMSTSTHQLPLIESICSGKQRDSIEAILTASPESIDELDSKGYSPLHWAAYFDDLDATLVLIKHSDNIISRYSVSGLTALHLAAQQNSLRVLSHLIQVTRADLAAVNAWQETPLHLASQNGHINAAKIILDHAVHNSGGRSQLLELVDKWNRSAFQVAVENGHKALALFLRPESTNADLEPVHAPVGSVDEEGTRAQARLLSAAFMSAVQSKGRARDAAATTHANASIAAPSQVSPTDEERVDSSSVITVRQMFSVTTEHLPSSSDSPETATSAGSPAVTSPTMTAASSSTANLSVASPPASSSSSSSSSRCPSTAKRRVALSQLVEYPGDVTAVKLMLEQADLFDAAGKDMFGLSALHKFSSWNKEDLLDLLLRGGQLQAEHINCQCPQGFTALHYAVEFGASRSLARLLEEPRVDRDVLDKQHRSFERLAEELGRTDLLDIIAHHKLLH